MNGQVLTFRDNNTEVWNEFSGETDTEEFCYIIKSGQVCPFRDTKYKIF